MENQIISKNDDSIINELWYKYIRHWPWFLLSIAICCGVAILYVKVTPNTYKRSASVIIKEDNNITELAAAFTDKSQFKSNSNVNNEIEAFKSPNLLQEVARRLNLNVSYKVKLGLKKIELYTLTPIAATFVDAQDQESFSFNVELLPDSVVILSNFEQDETKFNQSFKTRLNKTVLTPVGNVVITPTLFYSSNQFNVPINVTKSSIKGITGQLKGQLSVSLASKENTIIVLDFTDVSIQRADDVLTTIIAVYDENWIAERNKAAINTSKFINDRLPLIEQELGGIDDNLQEYKSQNLLTDIQSAASLYMKESSEYSGKIIEVRNQLSTARYIKKYLGSSGGKATDLLPTNTGLNNLTLESTIDQYNTLLLKRNGLIANSSERNPLILDMNNSLNAMKKSIIKTVDNLIVSLSTQLSSLQAQEARMTKKIESNPGQEKHLISIEREQKIKESLYLYLLQKREENALSLAMSTTNTRIINPPSGSNFPIEPKKRTILMIAFIVGMGLPISIIFGRDTLFPTIRGQKDLNGLSAPLLGTIPYANIRSKYMSVPLVQEKNRDLVNESFRIIRTNLELMSAKDAKIVMFTSVNPGSGKTFMTMNMAMCFALTGKKVVTLDLNMRNTRLSRMMSSPKAGVVDYLNGTTSDESMIVVKDYFYPGFDMIPVGDIPQNPVELLLGDRLKLLLHRLKSAYDYVFVDCTQIDSIADATIIGRFSDLVVFVVREGYSDRRIVPELENICKKEMFNNITIILNGTHPDITRKASKYKYIG